MSKQFYGIKYPFSEESDRLTFFDLNENKNESVRSMLLHILFTPKGQRLRQPNFGTNLIKYIFEPNDTYTWDNIKNEIKSEITKYLPQVIFDDIKLNNDDSEGESILVEIDYYIENNGVKSKNKTVVKI